MNLSAPKMVTFVIAVVLWVVGLLGAFVPGIDALFTFASQGAAFWLAILGGLVLILGNALNGM
jgi:hypothetical protein